MRVSPEVGEAGETAVERAGGGFDERNREGSQERDGEERQLETGLEELSGIEDEEGQSHGGEQVHGAAAAIEEAANQKHGEPRGGTHARRVKPGEGRVEPRSGHGGGQRGLLRDEAEAQREKKERRENGDVRAGDDQGVKGAGGAVIVCPDALQLVRLAHQDGLHHAHVVIATAVKPRDAVKQRRAEVHGETGQRRAAAAGQNANRASGAGGGPEHVLASEEMHVIEGAGIAVIARRADARIHLDLLAIAQGGEGFACARVEGDLRPRARLQLQHEALAFARHRRGFHHAAAEDDHLAALHVELGWRAGRVEERGERARANQAERRAHRSERVRPAAERQQTEEKKCSAGGEKFGLVKPDGVCGQNASRDGSHWQHEGVFQETTIVARWFGRVVGMGVGQGR